MKMVMKHYIFLEKSIRIYEIALVLIVLIV